MDESAAELPSPWTVLGIEPTLLSATVRRAYFALLEQHGPQQDPQGFARLRQAYERLTDPDSLAAAYLAVPVDLAAELTRFEARYGQSVVSAAQQVADRQHEAVVKERFVEHFSRRSFLELAQR